MKPEAQRIAIAEACGWQIKQIKVSGMQDVLLVPPGWPKDAMAYTGDLPDYLSDLNTMHEAEKVLTHEQLLGFDRHLSEQFQSAQHQHCIHATAAQRAEAFLKAKGLWQP